MPFAHAGRPPRWSRALPLWFTVLLALLVSLLAPAPAEADEGKKAAVAAADAWLQVVDAGEYGRSWDEAAAFFKSALGRADWERAAKNVRAPLGKLVSRKVASRTYTESLPGAPDGKYVVVQYETSFENNADFAACRTASDRAVLGSRAVATVSAGRARPRPPSS